MTWADVKQNLAGMMHGTTLNRVRNIEMAAERAQNALLSRIDPIDTQREAALANVVHDDIYNYPLASDYKKLIDLYPQDDRKSTDSALRVYPERFSLQSLIRNKQVTIESREGTKFIRINWRSRQGKVAHTMNSLTANGTWSTVGGAANIVLDKLFKISGSASIRFNLVTTGDGLQNSGLTALDLSDWDEQADWFIWLYFPSVSALISVTARWGNSASVYWQSEAQTAQADGTAFKVGWNLIRFPWTSATETGTVDPNEIDFFRFTIAATAAISNIRADNILVSLGRNFDIKYYSQFIFKNSAGTFISRPTADDDEVVLTGTALQCFFMELLKAAAQQAEGEDSAFDITFANLELRGDPASPDPIQRMGLYAKHRAEYPSAAKSASTMWFNAKVPHQYYGLRR